MLVVRGGSAGRAGDGDAEATVVAAAGATAVSGARADAIALPPLLLSAAMADAAVSDVGSDIAR